jgi:hypothetical protein
MVPKAKRRESKHCRKCKYAELRASECQLCVTLKVARDYRHYKPRLIFHSRKVLAIFIEDSSFLVNLGLPL